MPPPSDDIRLDPAEFRLLRELFNEHAGLVFGPESRVVMERRLRDRVVALGLSSFGEYFQYLGYDERGRAELEEAIDLVTINETYFMREAYQLRAFKDEILPALRDSPKGRERLSIWSAGCSTGEEVYSIALVVRESGLFPGRAVRVFGTDISRRVLAQARRAIYGSSSFRSTPPELRRRYFIETREGSHVVDDLRSVCQFGHLNLLDTPRATIVGRVDVIFCRNVLIYFDDAARRRVIETFYERLLPGGYLLLGHSESLLNVSTAFELVHLREDLVYRKPTTSMRVWPGVDSLAPAATRPSRSPTIRDATADARYPIASPGGDRDPVRPSSPSSASTPSSAPAVAPSVKPPRDPR